MPDNNELPVKCFFRLGVIVEYLHMLSHAGFVHRLLARAVVANQILVADTGGLEVPWNTLPMYMNANLENEHTFETYMYTDNFSDGGG